MKEVVSGRHEDPFNELERIKSLRSRCFTPNYQGGGVPTLLFNLLSRFREVRHEPFIHRESFTTIKDNSF